MREKIESVFCTKVYYFYGSRESGPLAGECKAGLLHVFTFNNVIEIIDAKNQSMKKGENGNVVVTNLHNCIMPFIRYEIGDIGILGPKKCRCGNPLPTLEKVVGRTAEQFVKEDGSIIDASTFFAHLIGVWLNKGLIKKFPVVQEDYKKIRILVVPGGNLDEIEQKNIENEIEVVMGKDCNIIWDFVDDIPKTKSGKYLYAKSLVTR